MTNIIIGDIAEGQKWYGQVEFMKQQLANNHRSNNAFMSTWKQLSPDVKVFINMVAGKPRAFIYAAGGAFSFGNNLYGQLGLGDTAFRNTPTLIASLPALKDFSAGYYSSYFVTTGGELFVTGDNSYGQLGLGDTTPRTTPVVALTGVKQVSAGEHFVLVLSNGGELYGAGRNQRGQLGLGDLSPRYTFTYIASDIKFISAGGQYSMAIANTGVSYGWGSNGSGGGGGNLGIGVVGGSYLVPTAAIGTWETISAGGGHTLFLDAAGDVYAAGDNTGYRLGGGLGELDFPTPTLVATDCVAISAGGSTLSAIIKSDGGLYTCGTNYHGELGQGLPDGSYSDDYVFIASEFKAVSTGVFHTLATTLTGDLYSFGLNSDGQLGLGDTINRSIPEKVNGVFSAVSAKYLYSLVRK